MCSTMTYSIVLLPLKHSKGLSHLLLNELRFLSHTDTSYLHLVQCLCQVGLHQGNVTAGVLGSDRLQYDVFGDTVNVASRMESAAPRNKVMMSSVVAERLQVAYPGMFRFEPPVTKVMKGKGEMLCCALYSVNLADEV